MKIMKKADIKLKGRQIKEVCARVCVILKLKCGYKICIYMLYATAVSWHCHSSAQL